MTVQLPLHEGALSLEQWQIGRESCPKPNAVAGSVDQRLFRGSRRWIASVRWRQKSSRSSSREGRTLTILYGTETGNSRDLAKGLAASATERGLVPKLSDLSDYKVRQLKDEQDILFIVSTYGEGDPPQPSVGLLRIPRRAARSEARRGSLLRPRAGRFDLRKILRGGEAHRQALRRVGREPLRPRASIATSIMTSPRPRGAIRWSTCLPRTSSRRLRLAIGSPRVAASSRRQARQAQSVQRDRAGEHRDRRPPLDEGDAPRRARSRAGRALRISSRGTPSASSHRTTDAWSRNCSKRQACLPMLRRP